MKDQLRELSNLPPEQKESLVEFLKEIQPFLYDGLSAGATNLVYIAPAEQLRRKADQIEYKEDLNRRVNEFIKLMENKWN